MQEPILDLQIGDITAVACEGLITAVNSKGLWAGACRGEDGSIVYRWLSENPISVDGAIQCVAGGQFHSRALILLEQEEGETLVVRTQEPHRGAFENVVFVVDDQKTPVYDILMAALIAADQAGLHSLAVPAIRTGVAHQGGGRLEQKAAELARAARDFGARARHVRKITFVVHKKGDLADLMEAALASPTPAFSATVQLGDITTVPSQGLITGINSEGMWGGGVDRAIYGSGGQQFHRQARVLLGKPDGEALVARSQHDHGGAYQNVVFVVDDLQKPLYDILLAGLRAAERADLGSVTIPAMRMGVMMSLGGPPEGKIADMARAVSDFRHEARNVKRIQFVIYGDPITCDALKHELALRLSSKH